MSEVRPEPPWIQTFTRRKFYPTEPRIEDLDVRDIARALSMQCRYVGHVDRFYSVAEHSVRLSRRTEHMLVFERGLDEGSEEVLITSGWGLIHDAAEAYLGDVSRPLKQTDAMSHYRLAERRLMYLIARWLSLPAAEPDLVKSLDSQILGTEVAHLKHPPHPEWAATTPEGTLVTPWEGTYSVGWAPPLAESIFLKRFAKLFGPLTKYHAKDPEVTA